VFEDEIDIDIIISFDDPLQFDDVGMRELSEEHDLTIHALSISGVREGIKIFFQCF
jgi:hypothetical protein